MKNRILTKAWKKVACKADQGQLRQNLGGWLGKCRWGPDNFLLQPGQNNMRGPNYGTPPRFPHNFPLKILWRIFPTLRGSHSQGLSNSHKRTGYLTLSISGFMLFFFFLKKTQKRLPEVEFPQFLFSVAFLPKKKTHCN